MISNIRVGDEEARAKDVLSRVYEYLLISDWGAERSADSRSQDAIASSRSVGARRPRLRSWTPRSLRGAGP
jgi:hypothetical protein